MSRELWFKRRTSRGQNREKTASRAVKNPEKFTGKNLARELYKNQRWYSHYLVKYVLCALFAVFWLRVGFAKIRIFPIGFLLGLLVIVFEKSRTNRVVEFTISAVFTILSFAFAIGVVI